MTPEEKQLLQDLKFRLDQLEKADRYQFVKNIVTSSDIKVGFFGVAPIVKQPAIAAITGGTTIDVNCRAAVTTIISYLKNYGFTS